MGMGAVVEALQVGMLVLIVTSLVVAPVVVWRDDRRWMERWRL